MNKNFNVSALSFKKALEKVGDGSGGGSTSKYQQPEWGVEENGVILPEVTLEANPDEGGAANIFTPFSRYIEAGKTYVIDYNGADYECAALNINGSIAIGNLAAMGVEAAASNEPFVMIAYTPAEVAEIGIYGTVLALDGSASFTFSIKGEVLHAIPSEYLGGGTYFVTVTASGDNKCTYDKPFGEIIDAINAGKQVFASFEGSNYPLSKFDALGVRFFGCTYYDVDKAYIFVIDCADDNTGTFCSFPIKGYVT